MGEEEAAGRQRPWRVVPFVITLRKIFSRFSPSATVSAGAVSHSVPSGDRHAVYLRGHYPIHRSIVPDDSISMSETAGKRIGHVSVCFDGKLVVWGGYNDERLHRNFPPHEVWVYDPLIQKWSLWTCAGLNGNRNDLPPGTSGATSCVIGSDMIIFGGYTMFGNVSTTYRINLLPLLSSGAHGGNQENRLLTIEKIEPANPDEAPIASDKNVCWSHEGRFYVFGGYGSEPDRGDRHRRLMPTNCIFMPDPGSQWNNSGDSRRGWNNQLACLDPETGVWSYPKAKGQWPMPRAAHAAAKLGSSVLIFGGRHDCRRVNDLWQLDLVQMSWTEMRSDDVPEGRSWHSLTAVSDDEVLLYGGLSNSRQPLSDCHVYNRRLNKWLVVSVPPEPRLWHTANFCPEDKQIFIYGGGTTDILDHSIKTSEMYGNDLITMRFAPDSLFHLCLDVCTVSAPLFQSQIAELPILLQKVLQLRWGNAFRIAGVLLRNK